MIAVGKKLRVGVLGVAAVLVACVLVLAGLAPSPLAPSPSAADTTGAAAAPCPTQDAHPWCNQSLSPDAAGDCCSSRR